MDECCGEQTAARRGRKDGRWWQSDLILASVVVSWSETEEE